MKKVKLREACNMYERQEMACKFLVVKYGGSRALGKRKCRQESTIKRVFKEIVWKGVGWIRWLRIHDTGGLK